MKYSEKFMTSLMAATVIVANSCCCNVLAETYESFTEPYRIIQSSAAAEGRVSEVYVTRGETVEPGQLLMTLDTSILDASRRIAEARIKNNARIEALDVEHQLKQQRLEQLADLLNQGAGSPEEVKRAEAEAKVARLNVLSAREEKQLAELQLAEIEARLEQRRVRSPVHGIVTDVLKEIGEYVSAADPQVARVVELTRLRMTFYLPTQVALRLKQGQTVQISYPDLLQQSTATVEYISQVTQADSGRVRVDLIADNKGKKMRSGVRACFEVEKEDTSVTLNKAARQR